MELVHSLLLNESALSKLPNDKRPVFVYEWLRFLDKVLPVANKNDIKEKQEHILKILLNQLERSPGPPTRKLLASNLACLFQVGDSYSLNLAINMCNDIIKSKDDSPSYLATKLAAITTLGEIYNRLGRMVGRSFEDTINILLKSMKQVESQSRSEIMLTLQHIVRGLGSAAFNCHKDIFKATKIGLLDRSMIVRSSACKCLRALIENYSVLQTTDVEGTVSLCFKALEDSNYEVRCEMSKALGFLLARTQDPALQHTLAQQSSKNSRPLSLDDVFNLVGSGFSKSSSSLLFQLNSSSSGSSSVVGLASGLGGINHTDSSITSASLATIGADINRSSRTINREIRVGVTHALLEFAKCMGEDWLERNLSLFLSKVLNLVGTSLKLDISTNSSVMQSSGISNASTNASYVSSLSATYETNNNVNSNNNHVEWVYARQCISFVLRNVVTVHLSNIQLTVARELCTLTRNLIAGVTHNPAYSQDTIIQLYIQSSSNSATNPLVHNSTHNQNILLCALHELSCLIQSLNSSAFILADSQIIESIILPCCLMPCQAIQLAAAFCLRSYAEAVNPQFLPAQLDSIQEKLRIYQSNHPDAVMGLSYALTALITALANSNFVNTDPDIIQSQLNKVISLAEEMIRSCNTPTVINQHNANNNRLLSAKTQSAWLLLASCLALGPDYIGPLLGKFLQLWRAAFPKTVADVEAEKTRGDAFTWQLSLESKSGALSSIVVFLEKCSHNLLTEELLQQRLMPLVETALALVAIVPVICRSHGNHLKGPAVMLRMRLYQTLYLLPTQAYNSAYNALLRELVAEFTLTDNPANTTTSLLRSLCHPDDSVVLGYWLAETDHKTIEDQLQPNSANGSGSLEHDSLFLILCDTSLCKTKGIVSYPDPLPLGIAVIDRAIDLFGVVYSQIQLKHRHQILEHFSECIRQSLPSSGSSKSAVLARHYATQHNIFSGVLAAMKHLASRPTGGGHTARASPSATSSVSLAAQQYSAWKKEALTLILGTLLSNNPILRCAAGECLGRMAQLVQLSATSPDEGASFVSEIAQHCFDRLQSDRDVVSRTGYSLALGCIHRYVGNLSGSHQHLGRSVGMLLALAQNPSSSTVQVWSLHGLSLLCGGPLFRRDYLELSLGLAQTMVLSGAPPAVHQTLGRLLGAIITALGPETGSSSSPEAALRQTCVSAAYVLSQNTDHPLIQAEAMACMQQLHLFAAPTSPSPRSQPSLQVSIMISQLYSSLTSPHLVLRRAAISCLRQLSQKETPATLNSALVLPHSDCPTAVTGDDYKHKILQVAYTNYGWCGALFQLLDWEQQDVRLRSDLEDTILCLLMQMGPNQSAAQSTLAEQIKMFREVIQSTGAQAHNATNNQAKTPAVDASQKPSNKRSNLNAHEDGDEDEEDEDDSRFKSVGTDENPNSRPFHGSRWPTKVFAMECFRKLLSLYNKDQLLLDYLSELVSIVFISATAEVDLLRLEGLAALQEIIRRFAPIRDREFPDQSILEQYQAQVNAALRPAFTPGQAAEVTAAACEVCSQFFTSSLLGPSNTEQPLDGPDGLHRVQQMLLTVGLEPRMSIQGLAVQQAWAKIYIALAQNAAPPHMASINSLWWITLREYARNFTCSFIGSTTTAAAHITTTTTPSLYTTQQPHQQQHHIFKSRWHVILLAAAKYLQETAGSSQDNNDIHNKFYLIIGLSMDAVCGLVSKQSNATIQHCLEACHVLVVAMPHHLGSVSSGGANTTVGELINIVHRCLLTRDNPQIHLTALHLLRDLLQWISSSPSSSSDSVGEPILDEQEQQSSPSSGGGGGVVMTTQTLEFACAEVVICGLTRYVQGLISSEHQEQHHQQHNRAQVLPLVSGISESSSSHQVIVQLIDTIGLLIPASSNSNTRQHLMAVLPCLLHLVERVVELEVIRPRVVTPLRARCTNDHSPWTTVLQQNLAESVLRLYTTQLIPLVQHSDPGNATKLLQMIAGFISHLIGSDNPSSNQVAPLYLAAAIYLKSPIQLVEQRHIQLQFVERIQSLWQQLVLTNDDDRRLVSAAAAAPGHQDDELTINVIGLVKTCYNLIGVDNNACARNFFARNISDLIINWLFKLPKIIDNYDVSYHKQHIQQQQQQQMLLLVSQLKISVDYIELLLDTTSTNQINDPTSNNNSQFNIISTLVPLLIILLNPIENQTNTSLVKQAIHKHALQRINSLAQRYNVTFKQCMQQPALTSLKLKLANVLATSSNNTTSTVNSNADVGQNNLNQQPKITLKMDFSNFTSK